MADKNNLSAPYLQTCRDALKAEQAASLAGTDNWAHVDREKVHADWQVVYRELAKGLDRRSPDDSGTQDLIRRHYEIACRFYKPSLEAYIGMALFYRENESMRAFHNAYHPDLVDFLVQAITAFAQVQGLTVAGPDFMINTQPPLHLPRQKKEQNGYAWAGVLLGVCGLTLFFWVPYVFPYVGVAAIALSSVGYSKAQAGLATNKMSAVLGIVLGVFALMLPVVALVGLAVYATLNGL